MPFNPWDALEAAGILPVPPGRAEAVQAAREQQRLKQEAAKAVLQSKGKRKRT